MACKNNARKWFYDEEQVKTSISISNLQIISRFIKDIGNAQRRGDAKHTKS
jgi:hypothetical protein